MKRIITTAMLVAAGISVSACNVSTGTALKLKDGDYNYAHYHNDDSDENNLSGNSTGATVTVAAVSSGASSGGFAGTSTGSSASGEKSSDGTSGQNRGSSGGSGQALSSAGSFSATAAPDKEDVGKEADPSQPENGGSASQQDWAGEDRSATHNDSPDKDGAAAEQARNEQDKDGGVSGPVPSNFQPQGPEKDGPNPTHEPDKDGATSTGAATAGNIGTGDTTPTKSDHLDKD